MLTPLGLKHLESSVGSKSKWRAVPHGSVLQPVSTSACRLHIWCRRSGSASASCARAARWRLWTSTRTGGQLTQNGVQSWHAVALLQAKSEGGVVRSVLYAAASCEIGNSRATPLLVVCSAAGRSMPPALATLMKATEPWTDEVSSKRTAS